VSPRSSPRPLAAALHRARADAEPLTALAAAQSAWPAAAGVQVAAEAEPVAERDGVITIACRSAAWAQELDLLGPELLARLNGALSEARGGAPEEPVRALRFTADHSRHDARS
jgi:predicted nucleic acid-binding Zn ribbon protein